MKKSKIVSLTIAASAVGLLSMGMANAAEKTVDGGQIVFTGNVTDNACSVNINSTSQTVKLADITLTKLKDMQPSDPANVKSPFTIQLDDCSTAVSQKVGFKFNGAADATAKAFTIDQGGSEYAKGVAIQLYQSDGTTIIEPNKPQVTPSTLVDGTNKFNFKAGYIKTAAEGTDPVAGQANATVTFQLTYS